MRLTLKPLNAVREEELGLISTPFMAVNELSSYFMRPERVDGLEYWWNHCIRQYNMSHPNYQHQSWEQLCKLIKQGELVLVHDKDRPPLSPACRQVNGQWVVESNADRLSFGLRHHLVSLKIERDERALRTQQQAVPASGSEGLPVEPVTSKRATLGPHVGGGAILSATAERQSTSFDDVYKKAPDAKVEIDSIANEIAGDIGGSVAKAPIKSRERALEKMNRDYGGDPRKIKDLARNTIVVTDDKIALVAETLKAKGANVKVIDSAMDTMGYSGVNAVLMTKSGIPAEIQVNSSAMIYAKENEKNARNILGNDVYDNIARQVNMPGGKGHKLYEEWRAMSPTSSEAKAVAQKSKDYYNAIRRSTNGN